MFDAGARARGAVEDQVGCIRRRAVPRRECRVTALRLTGDGPVPRQLMDARACCGHCVDRRGRFGVGVQIRMRSDGAGPEAEVVRGDDGVPGGVETADHLAGPGLEIWRAGQPTMLRQPRRPVGPRDHPPSLGGGRTIWEAHQSRCGDRRSIRSRSGVDESTHGVQPAPRTDRVESLQRRTSAHASPPHSVRIDRRMAVASRQPFNQHGRASAPDRRVPLPPVDRIGIVKRWTPTRARAAST